MVISVLDARFSAIQDCLASFRSLAPKVPPLVAQRPSERWFGHVSARLSKKEERKGARLQVAIPVFVRSRDENGKDSLEFATAINISPGGALVVVRRSLPKSAAVSLEIPSAPIGPIHGLKTSTRTMQAKAIWITHLDNHHLLGLKFDRPLGTDTVTVSGRHLRKVVSAV
jgi:hypothetical protein